MMATKTLKRNALPVVCMVGVFLLAFVIGLLHSEVYYAPDSIGYLGIASSLLGYDWSDLLGDVSSYYFGYPVLLVPIIALFHDSAYLYVAVLLLNAVFVVINFLCAWFFAGRMVRQQWLACFSAFVVSIYSYVLAGAQVFTSDLPFITCLWGLVALFVALQERPSTFKIIAIGCLAVYTVAVHKRGIAITVAATAVILIFIYCKGLRKSYLLVYLGITAALMALVFWGYAKTEDLFAAHIVSDVNSFEHRVNSFTYALLDFGNYYRILLAALGQFYYMFVSTVGLFPIGVLVCAQKSWKWITSKVKKARAGSESQNEKNWAVYLFLLLAFAFEFAIVSVTLMWPWRIDSLLMGRYIEFMSGPMMLVAICSIFGSKSGERRNKLSPVYLFMGIAVFCALAGSWSIYIRQKAMPESTAIDLGSMVGAAWLWLYHLPWWFGVAFCAPLLLFVIISLRRNCFPLIMAALSCVSIYFIGCFSLTLEKATWPRYNGTVRSEVSFLQEIRSDLQIDELFWPFQQQQYYMYQIQGRNPSMHVRYFRQNPAGEEEADPWPTLTLQEAITELSDTSMIAIPRDWYTAEIRDLFRGNYSVYQGVTGFLIFFPSSEKYAMQSPTVTERATFNVLDGTTENNQQISTNDVNIQPICQDGIWGMRFQTGIKLTNDQEILFGPYIELPRKNYRIQYTLRVVKAPAQPETLGSYRVTADAGRRVLVSGNIPYSPDENGIIQVTAEIHAQTGDTLNQIEFLVENGIGTEIDALSIDLIPLD